MKSTGVIIARFQTPYLHEGHHHLIRHVTGLHHRTVLVLGTAPVRSSKHNPFDFYTREAMIKADYPAIPVLPLRDYTDDKVWSEQLDALLTNTFPGEKFILYGSRDSFAKAYSGKLATATLPAFGEFSATSVRETHSDQPLTTRDFRLGINYAIYNRYDIVYPTVDIALLNAGHTQLLLGKKPNEATWRLPGGFADPTDESYEAAAARELQEECGALETTPMQYLGSVKIDDWRYRGETDKILSLLFTATLLSGTPQANDDLEALQWFDTSALPIMLEKEIINAAHLPFINKILAHLNA
ncbi:NUDIX hydrolase [Chitinophaga parva]|uniref:NUDIX hydrolase n=1 Tax=Chitinophaga parva TaxID=2169414 RepID=A0A2T7BEU9_9BACT|nr:NUDIX domain-containing protein [Chitinophaga parva]PUZ24822.1 NUDIX hydrolase [Chitinophaga parva]